MGDTALAHKSTGEVWGWGTNWSGQIGDNSISGRSSPVLVVGDHSFFGLCFGDYHCGANKVNGECWGWGFNGNGQLGNNTKDAVSSPILVIGSHSFIKVSGGSAMTYGLKTTGEEWAWGYGSAVGDNTVIDKSSPVLVVGDHSFVGLCGGYQMGSGYKIDGAIWTWGNNYYGQLGNGSLDHKSSPVLVIGNHSFVNKMNCGPNFCGAVKVNGEVWRWGRNTAGQLGTNNITSYSSPVLVVGNHSFVEISAANLSSLARKANGEVWCSGSNSGGVLGTNEADSSSHSSPVLVIGNHSFIEIFGGNGWALSRKSNGEVWSWGINSSGALGHNDLVSYSSPVLVVGNHSFDTLSYLSGGATKTGPFPLAFRI